jgi:hypothetical protein
LNVLTRREEDRVRLDLQEANLRGADLEKAELQDAFFQDAFFQDANLLRAYLQGALYLTQAQIEDALGDKNTRLPERLPKPTTWNSKLEQQRMLLRKRFSGRD